MHRSGTSLTANLIHEMGFHVSDNLWTDKFNKKGYWEDREVVGTNDLILHALGGDWKQVRRPGLSWLTRVNLKALGGRVRRIMNQYPSMRAWVMKDPRMSVTLPLWMPHMRSARFVLCVRSPLSVAESLQTRDRMSLAQGLQLWYQYTWLAMKHTLGHPVLVMHYEQYFGDESREQEERLAEFLGIDPTGDWASPVDRDLKHHNAPPSDVLDNPDVPDHVRALYRGLLNGVSPEQLLGEFASDPRLPALTFTMADELDFLRDWARRGYHRRKRASSKSRTADQTSH